MKYVFDMRRRYTVIHQQKGNGNYSKTNLTEPVKFPICFLKIFKMKQCF